MCSCVTFESSPVIRSDGSSFLRQPKEHLLSDGGHFQHPHRVLLGGPEQHRRMWRRRSPKTNLSSFGPVPAAAVAELTARAAVPKCPPSVLCSVKGLQSNHANPSVSISTVKLFLTIYSLVL